MYLTLVYIRCVLACQVHFLISLHAAPVCCRAYTSPQQQQQQQQQLLSIYRKKRGLNLRQAKSADVVRMRPPRTQTLSRSYIVLWTYLLSSTWRSQNKISHAQHCKKARDGSTLRRLFCAYCMHKVCVCTVVNYVLCRLV